MGKNKQYNKPKESKSRVITKVSNANDAIELVKNGGYQLEGKEAVWVTSDTNVFTEMSLAVTHSQKNKLEIYRVEL